MKEIHRISVIQDLPAVCNDRRNISYLHNSLFHSRSSRGIMQTLQKRDHCNYHHWAPLLWADSYSTGNNYTAQAACRATWMGAFWRKKKGGGGGVEGGRREREKRTELKGNVSTLLGKMSPAPHWNCPDSLSHLCSLYKRHWAARGVVGCVTQILSSALHSSAVTPASLHSSPWSSVLCRGEKDEQICLESCPWAIPVASATIWTVSPVSLCLFHVVSFLGPDYDPAYMCSGVKVLYCFSGGFKEMRKNLPFLLGKMVCKHLRRILLGFLNRFLGLGWAQSVS